MPKPQVTAVLGLLVLLILAGTSLASFPAASEIRQRGNNHQEEEDYRRLDGDSIQIHYPDGMAGAARRIQDRVPELLADAELRLDLNYIESLSIWVERDHEDFNRRMVALGGRPRPEHVAAVAFPYRDTIILKSAAWQRGAPGDFDVTLQHEIVHCILGALRRRHPGIDIPTWLDEGIAQWASEPLTRPRSAVLAQALRKGETIPFAELRYDFPDQEGASALAYAQSLSIVRYIAEAKKSGSNRNIPDLIVQLRLGKSLEEAVLAVTDLSFKNLEQGWSDDTRATLPFDINQLGEIAFGLSILVLSLLAYAGARVKRERVLARFDAEEAEGTPALGNEAEVDETAESDRP